MTTSAAGGIPAVAHDWVIVSGFTKFASRRDLDLALGKRLQPAVVKVEALVDKHSYFQGEWLLGLDHSKCSADEFRRRLARRSVDDEADPLIGAPTDRLEVKRVSYSPGGANNNPNLRLASALGITGSTVRLRNVRYNLGMDALLFFFREFELGPRGIEKVQMDNRFNQYLVHFRSPAEAERAMSTVNLKVASGNVMHLIWYSCCL